MQRRPELVADRFKKLLLSAQRLAILLSEDTSTLGMVQIGQNEQKQNETGHGHVQISILNEKGRILG